MNRGEDKVMNGATGWSNHWIGIITVIRYSKNSYPILRPLSDLTKEIEHNGDKFIAWYKIWGFKGGYEGYDKSKSVATLRYTEMIQLISWHFDVFGLIDAGLARKKE